MAIERKFNQTQQEVISLLADRFQTEPTEWHTRGNFTDCHGCDGWIFKSEKAATRYIYGDGLQIFMDYCNGACTEEDWLNILMASGFKKSTVKKVLHEGDWKKVVRMMTQTAGPRFFLSQYSGQVNTLSDGSLLYY